MLDKDECFQTHDGFFQALLKRCVIFDIVGIQELLELCCYIRCQAQHVQVIQWRKECKILFVRDLDTSRQETTVKTHAIS